MPTDSVIDRWLRNHTAWWAAGAVLLVSLATLSLNGSGVGPWLIVAIFCVLVAALAASEPAEDWKVIVGLALLGAGIRAAAHAALVAWTSGAGGPFLGPDSSTYYFRSVVLAQDHFAITASTTALDMARMGLDTMTHMNGLFQPLLKHSNLQPYPADFMTQGEHGVVNIPLQWEQIHEPGSPQWNALLDELLQRDLYINPTLAITSALRDQARARNEIWHATYTLPALWQAFQPSLTQHGSVFYDWTTAHEVSYRNFYQVFMRFLREFHARGGKVTLGSDAGFIYKIYGFTSIEELELLQEAGLTPLEVVRAATKYGAMELARASGKPSDFGVIRPGLRADLLIVEENPLQNFKVLYGIGVQRLNQSSGHVELRGGVKYTIKGGIVYDAKQLLRSVADMVAAARQQQ